MLVTDEMLEAGARAVFEHWQFAAPVKWVSGGNSTKQGEARYYARAVIDAVAPAIRAAALEEAAKECDFMAVETTKLADRLDDKESRLYAVLMSQAQAAKNRAAAIRTLKDKEPT